MAHGRAGSVLLPRSHSRQQESSSIRSSLARGASPDSFQHSALESHHCHRWRAMRAYCRVGVRSFPTDCSETSQSRAISRFSSASAHTLATLPSRTRRPERLGIQQLNPMTGTEQHPVSRAASSDPLPLRLPVRWAPDVCPGAREKVPPPSEATSHSATRPVRRAKIGSCSELPSSPEASPAASHPQPGRCWRGLRAGGGRG